MKLKEENSDNDVYVIDKQHSKEDCQSRDDWDIW